MFVVALLQTYLFYISLLIDFLHTNKEIVAVSLTKPSSDNINLTAKITLLFIESL